MQNEWLRLHEKKIKDITLHMNKMAYKGEFPEFPFNEYKGLLQSALVEIKRLQAVSNELQKLLSKEEKLKEALDSREGIVDTNDEIQEQV